ncbi:Hypothetical predicted protein, partial [Paramuricea clavata]
KIKELSLQQFEQLAAAILKRQEQIKKENDAAVASIQTEPGIVTRTISIQEGSQWVQDVETKRDSPRSMQQELSTDVETNGDEGNVLSLAEQQQEFYEDAQDPDADDDTGDGDKEINSKENSTGRDDSVDGPTDNGQSDAIDEANEEIEREQETGNTIDAGEDEDCGGDSGDDEAVAAVTDDQPKSDNVSRESAADKDRPYTVKYFKTARDIDFKQCTVYGYVFNEEMGDTYNRLWKEVKNGHHKKVVMIANSIHADAPCGWLFKDAKTHWHIIVWFEHSKPTDTSFHRSLLIDMDIKGKNWDGEIRRTERS